MVPRTVRLLALVLGLPVALAAQAAPRPAPDASWLVKRYFVDRAFPDEAAYLTGEMVAQDVGRPVGSLLPAGFKVTYRPLLNDGLKAVYAVKVVGQGQSTDSYAYLQKDSLGWKLAAVRSLNLPREFMNALRVLYQQHSLPDTTQESFYNMQLLAAPDTMLHQVFRQHRQAFGTLISEFKAQPSDGVAISPSGRPLPGSTWGPVARRLASLHLTSVYREKGFPGCTFVVIGGVQGAAAGYIHDEGGCRVPVISPDHFIYVERILPGWWVYKTS